MKNILILVLILFSFTGVAIATLGNTEITPFHIVSTFLLAVGFRKYLFKPIQGKQSLWLVLLMLGVVISSLLQNSNVFSILHFIYWGCIFLVFHQLFDRITTSMMIKVCKIILWSYFINILFSFLLYKIGVSNVVSDFVFPHAIDEEGEVRFWGFSSEPSYTAIIITVAFVVLLYTKGLSSFPTKLRYLSVYILSIILIQSTYGYICLLFVVNMLFKGYKILRYIPLIIMIIGISLYSFENAYISRLTNLVNLFIDSKSIENLFYGLNLTDSSAYFRVGPSYLYLQNLHFSDLSTWFGFGLGNDSEFFASIFSSEAGAYERLALGFFPASFYTGGIVFSIGMLILIFKYMLNELPLGLKIFVLIVFFNCGFSTQLFWYVLILFSWMSYYGNNQKKYAFAIKIDDNN